MNSSPDSDFGWWSTDIAGVSVSYTATTVSTRTKFHHRIGRYSWQTFSVVVDFNVDNAEDYRFEIGEDESGVFVGRYGFRRVCSMTYSIDRVNKVVRTSAPSRSFGSPAKLRVQAGCHDSRN